MSKFLPAASARKPFGGGEQPFAPTSSGNAGHWPCATLLFLAGARIIFPPAIAIRVLKHIGNPALRTEPLSVSSMTSGSPTSWWTSLSGVQMFVCFSFLPKCFVFCVCYGVCHRHTGPTSTPRRRKEPNHTPAIDPLPAGGVRMPGRYVNRSSQWPPSAFVGLASSASHGQMSPHRVR
jgi:hypothetical protein